MAEGAVGLKFDSGAEIRLRQLREAADGRVRHAPSAAEHDAMLREESTRLPGEAEARLEIRVLRRSQIRRSSAGARELERNRGRAGQHLPIRQRRAA